MNTGAAGLDVSGGAGQYLKTEFISALGKIGSLVVILLDADTMLALDELDARDISKTA